MLKATFKLDLIMDNLNHRNATQHYLVTMVHRVASSFQNGITTKLHTQ